MYICINVYMYKCLYVYVYVYIYICTHTIHSDTGDTIHGTLHIYPYPGVLYHFTDLNFLFEQQTKDGLTK